MSDRPKTRRRIVATGAGLLALALAVAATALAVSPKPNATYRGTASGKVQFATTFTGKDPVSLTTSGNGKTLSLTYTDTICSLAASGAVTVAGIKIELPGTYSVALKKSAPTPDTLEDGHKVVTTTTLKGTFVSPTRTKGTLEYTQTEIGSPSHCGPIKLAFTATS